MPAASSAWSVPLTTPFPTAADGKTKSLVSAVSKVSGGAKKVLLVLSQYDEMVDRAGRNVENLTINVAASLQVRGGRRRLGGLEEGRGEDRAG